ncbi:FACT complex subunit [Phlyctochytrium bullatum]|nr:FACT complex subunit [Phlyctochytrium bullatum]
MGIISPSDHTGSGFVCAPNAFSALTNGEDEDMHLEETDMEDIVGDPLEEPEQPFFDDLVATEPILLESSPGPNSQLPSSARSSGNELGTNAISNELMSLQSEDPHLPMDANHPEVSGSHPEDQAESVIAMEHDTRPSFPAPRTGEEPQNNREIANNSSLSAKRMKPDVNMATKAAPKPASDSRENGAPARIAGKTFDNIYLAGKNGPQSLGRLKMAEPGIGFQEAETKQLLTIPAGQIKKAHWLRCAREFELRIELNSGVAHKFDGFQRDSFDVVSHYMKSTYGIVLEQKEMSLRGYNWGKCEFQGNYMTFNVANKPAFEVPLADVAGATLSGKHEVSLELANPIQRKDGDTGSRSARVREDLMVEIQFYIPGMVTASQVDDTAADGKKLLRDKDAAPVTANGKSREEGEINEEDEELVLGEDGEAISAAAIFCETVKNRADVSVYQGDSIVGFEDLLCLTPRGRYDFDFYAAFFRLRGKSNDFRILYSSVKKVFCLPKPDDLHFNFVIQLDPPLRQGQTRYPFLVFQFDRDVEVDAAVKLDDETLAKQFEGRLQKDYDGPIHLVISEVFKAFTNMKVITEGAFKSAQGFSGLKCSLKANEAFLFPLDKFFVSLPKPTTLIPHSDISVITFGRVNAAASSSTKTFEIKISTDGADYTYSSIPREEYENLDEYCRSKKLKVTTEMGDGGPNYADEEDDDDDISDGSDEDGKRRRRASSGRTAVDMALDDEDESEDEDYVDKSDGSETDPDLEFDSDAKTDSESEDEDEKPKKSKKKEKGPAKESKKKEKKESSRPSSGGDKKRAKKEADEKPAKKAKKEESSSSKQKKEKEKESDKIKSAEFVDSDDDA